MGLRFGHKIKIQVHKRFPTRHPDMNQVASDKLELNNKFEALKF